MYVKEVPLLFPSLCTKLKTKRCCYIRHTLSGFLKCCTIDSTCITFDFKLTGISLTGAICFLWFDLE